jgi:hypothetical protein
VGVWAFCKSHQVRGDLLVNMATSKSSLITPDAVTPLRRYAVTPIRRYADTPIRRYAVTPLRRYAVTPLRRYADTPLRRYAVMPIRRYAGQKACPAVLPSIGQVGQTVGQEADI